MGEAAPIQPRQPDAWLSVDRAAEATGESQRTWRRRAIEEAKDAQRSGRKALAVMRAPPGGTGKAVWVVHRSLDRRLGYGLREDRVRGSLSARYPAHLVERAFRRHRWIQAWREECRHTKPDRAAALKIVAQAKAVEPADFKISVRSILRWWKEYNRMGDDGAKRGVEGLIDRYGTAKADDTPESRSPEGIVYFYEVYRSEVKPTIRTAHELTLREAERQGWRWPKSYSATVCWLDKHDDISLTCLLRHGRDAWSRKFLPHLQIDYNQIEPGEMYVADHHQADWWVTYKGKQIRPWFTVVQDCRSRCIVGWRLGPAPHQDSILASLRMAFRDWAIPKVMRIDNGKDYTSKTITGVTKQERRQLRKLHGPNWQEVVKRGDALLERTDSRWLGISGELGVRLIFATPYSPWSKGTLERFFGRLEEQHGKSYASYCGNSSQNKPPSVETIRSKHADVMPTLEESAKRLGEWLDVYHRSDHRGIGDQTPLAVWHTASALRRAVDDDLDFLMNVRGLYRVGANGVTCKVGAATLHYGGKNVALKRHVGRKVLVALDPEDISYVLAFTPDREKRVLIARLEPNAYIHPHTCSEDAREAIAEMKREQSVMHKAERSAARRSITAAQRISEHTSAKHRELMATGTDDATAQPRILPVRTGFEAVSKGPRTAFESVPLEEPGDVSDLFMTESEQRAVDMDDDGGMSDLFMDEPAPEGDTESLDELYDEPCA